MRRALLLCFAVAALALPGCPAQEKTPDSNRLIADLRSPDPEKSGQARLQLIRPGELAVELGPEEPEAP